MITFPGLRRGFMDRLNRLDFASAMRVAARKAKAREEFLRLGGKSPRLSREALDELLGDFQLPSVAAMFSNTRFYVGPIALTTTLTTNIFNAGTTTGGINCTSSPFDKLYVNMGYVSVVNKTGSAATVSLWVGATGANAAGTEWLYQATSVAANFYVRDYPQRRFGQADFLVGGAGTATALSISLAGEIGIGA